MLKTPFRPAFQRSVTLEIHELPFTRAFSPNTVVSELVQYLRTVVNNFQTLTPTVVILPPVYQLVSELHCHELDCLDAFRALRQAGYRIWAETLFEPVTLMPPAPETESQKPFWSRWLRLPFKPVIPTS